MRLTRDEITLVACIVLALVVGAVVKRHRDQARALAPAAATLAQPAMNR